MTRTEKLEARLAEYGKAMSKWSKKLNDAENVICRAVPELKRLGKRSDRLMKELVAARREAKRKPKIDPALNDSVGL